MAAVVVLIAAAAVYVSLLPKAPTDEQGRPLTESQDVRRRAMELLRAEQPEMAAELLEQYIANHPKDLTVYIALAELHLHRNDPKRCDAVLDQAQAFAPDDAGVLWVRGMSAQKQGRDPSALFRQAAETPNASPDVQGMFGLYLLGEEQAEEAERYLRRAVEGQTNNGMVHAALGQIALGRNQIDEAHRLLKRATELTPQSPAAWALLAEVQTNRGEADQAVASLREALKVAGGAQRGAVLMELGKAHMAERRWSEAAEMFAQAADYPAVRAPAAFQAAQCYYFTDAYAKAMHYIDQAQAFAPDDPKVNEWKRKIETARYGQPASDATRKPLRSVLDVPPEEEKPSDSKKTGEATKP
ncbi:MAG: tetratricopeptide repeat protein [Phycisphaerae bacterium]|nr:tetratricopeptide repeat protein [Phycisphaerae bacterium]